MAPPIAGVVMMAVIVMTTACFCKIGLFALPIAQTVLRLAIESALIRGIVPGPVTFVRSAIAGRDNALTR